ncbi:MAG TPA: MaoC/PaaZ C-terminal domain-containing protein [Nitrososphaerales archaeon]|nr:MaoC/PaaZ C-terminal domain-containing protein [Nitrososphaerales archaeon]
MLLFHEDFKDGQKFVSKEREITHDDIQKFANLTGDLNKLHLEQEFAKSAGFSGIVAHGVLTLSIAIGLWHSLDLTNGTILAFAGLSNVSFKAPVYPGDRIHIEAQVLSKRELASRPNAGLVRLKLAGINSRKETVLEAELALIIKKKGPTNRA